MTNHSLAQALHLIQQGQWDAAHELVQSHRDPLSCWIHAWLHRYEGDSGNAGYWYSSAGREYPDLSLEEELQLIAEQVQSIFKD